MSERIRYRKAGNNVHSSVRVFYHPTNGARYKVLLKPEEHAWYVLDSVTDLIAANGHHLNVNKAKIAVRQALKSLGVELETEKRIRVPAKE